MARAASASPTSPSTVPGRRVERDGHGRQSVVLGDGGDNGGRRLIAEPVHHGRPWHGADAEHHLQVVGVMARRSQRRASWRRARSTAAPSSTDRAHRQAATAAD